MSRLLILVLLISCSNIIDVEVSDYFPFKKYSTWIYLDQNNNQFQLYAIQSDSFFIILDFEGDREYLTYTGDIVLIRRTIEYSQYDQLIKAYEGDLPYFPYPFVNGFNREYTISGSDYIAKTTISVQRDNLRYTINYYYFEQTPNSKKTIRRIYTFSPDSFIIYAQIGPDTIISGNFITYKDAKILKLKEIIARSNE